MNPFYTMETSIYQTSFALKSLGFDKKVSTSFLDVKRRLLKAKYYNYKRVLCPYPLTKNEEVEIKKEFDLSIIIDSSIVDLNTIIDSRNNIITIDTIDISSLQYIAKNLSKSIVLIIANKKIISFKRLISILENYNIEYFFYFPIKQSLNDKFLSVRQIYTLKSIHGEKVKTHPYISQYDPRVPIDIEFRPILKELVNINTDQEIIHSIIIPVFNQKKEIQKTLLNLYKQDCTDNIEIIVVDDGSTDDLYLNIENLTISLPSNFSFKFIRNPRVFNRKMGDGRFRAGISRNIGIQASKGNNIHFLDADIIVPTNYLSIVTQELKTSSLIQIKRMDLKKKDSDAISLFEDFDIYNYKKLSKDKYWNNFYNTGDWNSLYHPWKYLCSYGISLSRTVLEEVSGFTSNYLHYGFEDTDLGYKLYKNKKKFTLSNVVALHQAHSEERSEFKNQSHIRKKTLRKSAQIFFHNNLDIEIYREMIDFLRPKYSFLDYIFYLIKLKFKQDIVIRLKM